MRQRLLCSAPFGAADSVILPKIHAPVVAPQQKIRMARLSQQELAMV
jgi:hypothetical protein